MRIIVICSLVLVWQVTFCTDPPLCMHYAQAYTCRCYILILWFTSLRAGLYRFLPPDTREFEDLVKIVSSCYLDSSSRGTFSYCKARLIHNELLEKEVGRNLQSCTLYQSHVCKRLLRFDRCVSICCGITFMCQFIEKRREMKQEGRTEQELTESFCFLFPDKSKVLMMDKLWSMNPPPFFVFNVILILVCSLVCPAPVDLWKGSVSWTLKDYDTRKSISGYVSLLHVAFGLKEDCIVVDGMMVVWI